ncbi:MAG: glucose PTS transporter subunit EIIB, partial [Paenibacillus macerans]|nr:glucose PTS transporter subunit EIIB [Paenibacillus macerans]
WYLVLIVGLIWFAVYYFVFRFAITKFNLKTPGREDNDDTETVIAGSSEDRGKAASNSQAAQLLSALGGPANIQSLDNCITRLRLVVDDMEKLDEPALKKHGALGVVKLDAHNLQVIIGAQVNHVRVEIGKLMESQGYKISG